MRTRLVIGPACTRPMHPAILPTSLLLLCLTLRLWALTSFSALWALRHRRALSAIGLLTLAVVIGLLKTVPTRADPFMLAPLKMVRPNCLSRVVRPLNLEWNVLANYRAMWLRPGASGAG